MAILRDWDLGLDVDQVLRGQGADPVVIRKRRPALVQAAEWALKEGLPLLEPVVLTRELNVVALRHERLILKGEAFLAGSLIAQHLAGARRIIAMLCSIGEQLESVSNELFKSDPLYAMALEGVGTAAVEALGTLVCSYFENQAPQEGLHPSIPLSPGMVGWPVDPGQKQVFDLLDAGQIGVHLNANLMIVPRMSMTQVLGFSEQPSFEGRTCDYCNLRETCRYQDHYAPAAD
ncbi:MAG: hypothetical protein P8Z00_23945 [Anaerolineales bacterium]|jgi:hypothetical protein